MAAAARPLPPVVGSTENALGALLASLLAATPLESTRHWVALNVAASAGDAHAVSVALKADLAATSVLLEDLRAAGLVEQSAGTWHPTSSGTALLRDLRGRIAEVTDRLVRDLLPNDIETTIRVLEHLRRGAERELERRRQQTA